MFFQRKRKVMTPYIFFSQWPNPHLYMMYLLRLGFCLYCLSFTVIWVLMLLFIPIQVHSVFPRNPLSLHIHLQAFLCCWPWFEITDVIQQVPFAVLHTRLMLKVFMVQWICKIVSVMFEKPLLKNNCGCCIFKSTRLTFHSSFTVRCTKV